VAKAIKKGAEDQGCTVRALEVNGANYKRDVFEFADAVIIGSGVYNGNAAPEILTFINSFDFLVHHPQTKLHKMNHHHDFFPIDFFSFLPRVFSSSFFFFFFSFFENTF